MHIYIHDVKVLSHPIKKSVQVYGCLTSSNHALYIPAIHDSCLDLKMQRNSVGILYQHKDVYIGFKQTVKCIQSVNNGPIQACIDT